MTCQTYYSCDIDYFLNEKFEQASHELKDKCIDFLSSHHINSKNKTVAIYGASKSGEFVFNYLKDIFKERGLIFQYFIDKSKETDESEKTFCGHPVLNLAEFKNAKTDIVICATGPQHNNDILEHLISIDFPQDRIAFVYSAERNLSETESSSSETSLYNAENAIFFVAPYNSGKNWFQGLLFNTLNDIFDFRKLDHELPSSKVTWYENVLNQLKPGYYMIDHYEYSPIVMDFIKQKEIKPVLLTRDPRDAFMSLLHWYYFALPGTNSKLHRNFGSIRST